MRGVRVLVACEESQVVAKAFRERGHEACSCDIGMKGPLLRLSVPLAPPSLNEWYAGGRHWIRRKKIRDLWHASVILAVKKGKVKPIIADGPVSLTTQSHFSTRRQRDCSNCFPANKLAEDALVHAGILMGDTTRHVKSHHVLTPVFGVEADETIIEVWA